MGKDCMVNVTFTGPSGAWTLHIQTPRPEKLTNFAWQVNDSSEMGSTAPQTKYAPLTVSGYRMPTPLGFCRQVRRLPAGSTSSFRPASACPRCRSRPPAKLPKVREFPWSSPDLQYAQ